MVAQTGMNGTNRPTGIFGHISEFLSDGLTLAELQFQLFVADSKEGLAKVLVPVIMLVVGAFVLLCCVPLGMAVTVVALAEVGEFTWMQASLLALGIWMMVGGGGAIIGIAWLRSRLHIYDRSLLELEANARWARSVLQRFRGKPAPPSPASERFTTTI
jgi:hypothetical protein